MNTNTLTNTLQGTIDNCLPSPYYYPYTWPFTGILPASTSSAQAWIAYDEDTFVAFPAEIEALRYAVERHMQVKQLTWGEDIQAQLEAGC